MKFIRNLAYISNLLSLLRIVKAELEPFIVGGDLAQITKYPHSAFLAITCEKSRGKESWACGSSIVNQHILLTAAHCLDKCGPSTLINAIVGSNSKKTGASYSAKNFRIHQKYDSEYVANDIALLSLKKPLVYSKSVQRIALLRDPPSDVPAKVAGWGLVDEDNQVGTLLLKETDQNVLSRSKCVKILQYMNKNTFCTTSGSGKSKIGYAAEGDSGSALIVRRFIQIGLVSYKNPHLAVDVVVFTDVSKYLDWITTTARQLYCG